MPAMVPEEAFAKLGELAPREIARLLTDLGIRGHRANSVSCPIAVYVQQETGDLVHVLGDIWRGDDYFAPDQPTPASVRAFVGLFDEGYYPDLLRPSYKPRSRYVQHDAPGQ